MIEILKTILPVALMLFIGILARKSNMLSREGVNAMKKVVVNITLPAVMLHAFASMTWTMQNVIVTLLMFLVCLAALLLGKLFAGRLRFLPYLTTGFEAGMLGYALFTLAYGAENVSGFATVDLGQVLFVFTVYKLLLGREGSQKITGRQLVKEMLTSPVIIAIAAGVLLGATGLYAAMVPSGAAGVLDACTDFVSAPTSAIILITIGYDLELSHIPWKTVARAVVVRVLVMAGLRFAIGALLRLTPVGDRLDPALNIMFILPPPYVLPVFADDEKERGFVSSSLSLMTVITIAAFFILVALR
ncbi:MAG: hypothetical protein IJT05_10205 [Lachnospiraceae bacterium]|nr:hypothetical protein [Lachnospiraceae bacterium]